VAYAEQGVERYGDGDRLHWIKVFRSDSEVYTCWRWHNPRTTKPNERGEPVPVPASRSHLDNDWWEGQHAASGLGLAIILCALMMVIVAVVLVVVL